MQLINAAEVPVEKPRTGHREAGILFRRLFRGRPRARGNFEVSIARTEGVFRSPRHRHNFDQVRVGLSGQFGDGKKLQVGPGQFGYYPEGTYYEIECQDTELLLLQFGGANGDGYPSYDDLYEAYAEMAKIGTFRDGIFLRHERENLPPGEKKNMDGYEALWQHIFGRPVVYPKPRYHAPIIMDSARYRWLADLQQPGVRRKLLGVFTERAIEIAQIELDAGATLTESTRLAPKFLFAHAGSGRSAEGAWQPWSTAKLEPGESVRLVATSPMTLTAITLPWFAPEESADGG